MAATIRIPAEFTAHDKYSSVVKKMTMATRSFSQKGIHHIRRLDMKVSRTFGKMKSVVGNFGLFLGGAALTGALSRAISITADFEQANANLASILGIRVDKTLKLQSSSQKLGATTAFTASQVASLQTEYAKLGFTENEILKVTNSTLALASATKTDLTRAATQVGSSLRAFGLDASQAARISDVFALAQSKAAVDMDFFNNSMSTVAPVASKFGFKIEEVTALLGSLGDSGFDASSAATATRNILLNLADSGGKLAKSLGRPVKDLPSLVAGLKELQSKGVPLAKMLDLTDKRSVAAFATFVGGTDKLTSLNQALKNAGGTAQKMAAKQLNTLAGKTTILKSAYEGFILSLDNGKGPYSETIKNIVDIATQMLSLASGTAKSTSEMTGAQLKIRQYAETAMSTIKVIGTMIGLYAAFKIALMAYSVAQGIYTTATTISTAATTAFGIAMNLGLWPILLIVAAIAGLIALFYNWDSVTAWFAKQWEKFTQWIGNLWDGVVKWFTDFDFKEFFVGIGQSILKFMLMPLKGVLTLLSKLPGKVGSLAKMGLDKIGDITVEVDVNSNIPKKPLSGPELSQVQSNERLRQAMVNAQIGINISDPGGYVDSTTSNSNIPIPVKITSTQGVF